MNFDIEALAKARVARKKQLRKEYDKEYRVEYTEQGRPRNRTKTVFCDHVIVDSGLVRFVDKEGDDRWTIHSQRVVEYSLKQSPK